jgi:hypothetical protein
MGAWGNMNFDNDNAMDFLEDVQEQGKGLLASKIATVAEITETDYLEAPTAAECLAAIEYFAAEKGKPAEDFPEEASEWLSVNQPLPLVQTSAMLKVLNRIKTRSELQELWEEAGELKEWQMVVDDLEKRVS